MSTSHTTSEFVVAARGQDLVVVGKPGVWSWDRANPGTLALLEIPRFEPGLRVLDLGCGTGIIGALAGLLTPSGSVTLVDCTAAAVACASRTVEANRVSNARVGLGDGTEGLGQASFDLVLSHLPRGREVQRELIRGAARVLRPGGRFVFVASTRVGVKGCIAYARGLFGRCGVVRQKKGYHVAMAVRPDGIEPPAAEDAYVARSITLDGQDTVLVSKPGVFAWDRLDGGTQLLIDGMEIDQGDRVLDLGCGTGLAGLAAARRAPEGAVVLVDSDLRAARSARRTLDANGALGADVVLSDGVSQLVRGPVFDAAITNPPFHQGREVDYGVAHQFIRDARQVLRPGGRLFLVANRFIGYQDVMDGVFGSANVVAADRSYQVLTARV